MNLRVSSRGFFQFHVTRCERGCRLPREIEFWDTLNTGGNTRSTPWFPRLNTTSSCGANLLHTGIHEHCLKELGTRTTRKYCLSEKSMCTDVAISQSFKVRRTWTSPRSSFTTMLHRLLSVTQQKRVGRVRDTQANPTLTARSLASQRYHDIREWDEGLYGRPTRA